MDYTPRDYLKSWQIKEVRIAQEDIMLCSMTASVVKGITSSTTRMTGELPGKSRVLRNLPLFHIFLPTPFSPNTYPYHFTRNSIILPLIPLSWEQLGQKIKVNIDFKYWIWISFFPDTTLYESEDRVGLKKKIALPTFHLIISNHTPFRPNLWSDMLQRCNAAFKYLVIRWM